MFHVYTVTQFNCAQRQDSGAGIYRENRGVSEVIPITDHVADNRHFSGYVVFPLEQSWSHKLTQLEKCIV